MGVFADDCPAPLLKGSQIDVSFPLSFAVLRLNFVHKEKSSPRAAARFARPALCGGYLILQHRIQTSSCRLFHSPYDCNEFLRSVATRVRAGLSEVPPAGVGATRDRIWSGGYELSEEWRFRETRLHQIGNRLMPKDFLASFRTARFRADFCFPANRQELLANQPGVNILDFAFTAKH
jgi:hypothetical protein